MIYAKSDKDDKYVVSTEVIAEGKDDNAYTITINGLSIEAVPNTTKTLEIANKVKEEEEKQNKQKNIQDLEAL